MRRVTIGAMSNLLRTSPAELADVVAPWGDAITGGVVVELDRGGVVPTGWSAGPAPVVIVGLGSPDAVAAVDPGPFDVLVTPDDDLTAPLLETLANRPVPSAALAVLLRSSIDGTVESALAAESAVYSTLQAGADFLAWRRQSTTTPRDDLEPPVRTERVDHVLRVVLDRPTRHNAVSAALRDALVEALTVALVDDSIERVELSGAGPSFCSGGDLGEFGSFPDPAIAHVTRLARSPARLMHLLRDRLQVVVHGSCLGAGVEWPAFAGRVTAAPDATFGLPEVALGLVPGAGGTASIPRRIGRRATMALALSGVRIDAPTALSWGLVDAIA